MQTFDRELFETAEVFALTRNYLFIDIDKTLIAMKPKCLCAHLAEIDKIT